MTPEEELEKMKAAASAYLATIGAKGGKTTGRKKKRGSKAYYAKLAKKAVASREAKRDAGESAAKEEIRKNGATREGLLERFEEMQAEHGVVFAQAYARFMDGKIRAAAKSAKAEARKLKLAEQDRRKRDRASIKTYRVTIAETGKLLGKFKGRTKADARRLASKKLPSGNKLAKMIVERVDRKGGAPLI